jgi:acyl-CoA reductase-like NAD-dependent aldehyde dehydrogenase
VLSIIAYTDEDDPVAIANDSDYGLGGSLWTADPDRARRVARRIRTGTVGLNGYLPDPAGPWGGVKSSGLGRELAAGRSSSTRTSKPFTPERSGRAWPGFTQHAEPGNGPFAVSRWWPGSRRRP